MNKGQVEGTFQVSPKGCCIGTDCLKLKIQQAVSKYVLSMHTERFSFYVLSSVVLNQRGYCSFDVSQHGIINLSIQVDWENKYSSTPGLTPSSCTYDQFFTTSCLFVNCTQKYSGLRSFANVQSGYCEWTPSCQIWKEVYDPVNNWCPPISQTQIKTNATKTTSGKIDCGAHGRLSKDENSCICDDGWTTSLAQSNIANFKFCTIQTTNTTQSGNALLDSVAMQVGIATVSIIGLVVVFLCGCGGLFCICRVAWKQHQKTKNTSEKAKLLVVNPIVTEETPEQLQSEEFNHLDD